MLLGSVFLTEVVFVSLKYGEIQVESLNQILQITGSALKGRDDLAVLRDFYPKGPRPV